MQLYNTNGALMSKDEFMIKLAALNGGLRHRSQVPADVTNENIMLTPDKVMNTNLILTPDDFEKLTSEEQAEFKRKNPTGYASLWAKPLTLKEDVAAAKNKVIVPDGSYNLSDLKNGDDFEKLTDGQKIHLKSNYPNTYMKCFGLDVNGKPLRLTKSHY